MTLTCGSTAIVWFMAAAGLITLLAACSALRVTRGLPDFFGFDRFGLFGCMVGVSLATVVVGSVVPISVLPGFVVSDSVLLLLVVWLGGVDCWVTDSLFSGAAEGGLDMTDWNELQPDRNTLNVNSKLSFGGTILSRFNGSCCMFLTLSTFCSG